MDNPLLTKLEKVAHLDQDDRDALHHVCADVRMIDRHRDIIREGDRPGHVHLVLEGWAARYKVLPDGSRQITAFLIPGDFCDIHITILKQMDHSIAALTPIKMAFVPQEIIQELPHKRPQLARALWWATLVDEAVLRSWIVNLGRRDAYTRIAHLMCEMEVRLANVGQATGGSIEMPLTQEELGDALGLTAVHVNRVLKRLRDEETVTLKNGALTILNAERLREVAGFDPNYLHLKGLDELAPRVMDGRPSVTF